MLRGALPYVSSRRCWTRSLPPGKTLVHLAPPNSGISLETRSHPESSGMAFPVTGIGRVTTEPMSS